MRTTPPRAASEGIHCLAGSARLPRIASAVGRLSSAPPSGCANVLGDSSQAKQSVPKRMPLRTASRGVSLQPGLEQRPPPAAKPLALQPVFLAQALHQPAAATCLPANSGQPPAASVALPWNSWQLAQLWSLACLGYFFAS